MVGAIRPTPLEWFDLKGRDPGIAFGAKGVSAEYESCGSIGAGVIGATWACSTDGG